MRWRKIYLGLKLWTRSCIYRRQLKRLKRELRDLAKGRADEKALLIKHYEHQLSIERVRNETLHTEWANRFLQLQKLSTLGISTSLIEEKAALREAPTSGLDQDENALNPTQLIELDERREKFFRDGYALEKSRSEIENRWEDIKLDVIADVKMSVN